MPKARASKLVPKFIGPYRVLKTYSETSNYDLELPAELARRRLHNKFHVGLLRPHYPNDDSLFPNRKSLDPYDFGTPDAAKWIVEEIMVHRWKGCAIEFKVKWNLGDSTWEPLQNCNELWALDSYVKLMGIEDWDKLPHKLAATHNWRRS
jgi:hypothetical protein